MISYPRHVGDLRQAKHGARSWQLINPYKYWINEQYVVNIPSGFVNDLASIPRILTPIVPKIGKHDEAALIHDWLYESGAVSSWHGRQYCISRYDADCVFYQALIYFGVRKSRAWLMYAGVRAGGWVAWKRHNHPPQTVAIFPLNAFETW